MKIAPKLLSAAFALAAIASVALPTAQPADAANAPDLEAKIVDIGASQVGKPNVQARVANIGNATSSAYVVDKFCGYLPPTIDGSRLVQWARVDMSNPTVMPALNGSSQSSMIMFTCPLSEGRAAVAARISIVASSGETNAANNDVRQWALRLS